jgi:hypothetical protein
MRLILWMFILGLFACRGGVDAPAPAGNTSSAAVLPGRTNPSPQTGKTAGDLGGPTEECGAEVTRSEDAVEDHASGLKRSGCRVRVEGTFGGLRGTQRPEARIAEMLQRRGFKHDNRFDADGPDGTVFALRAKTILCIVDGKWDGGDDSDPTYVPGDWYMVEVACRSEPLSAKP